MKLVTVIGARPQFIKAAAVSRAIAAHNRNADKAIADTIVHTGQHYDHAMSAAFFDELCLPAPTLNLNVGSGHHGAQTGAMIVGLESYFANEMPDMVLVYGDTNSTLAAALAAAKLQLPLAHVEAGLRSRNMRMPEEINRIVTDRLADLLFTGTEQAVANLTAEGLSSRIRDVGDVMYDCVRYFREETLPENETLSKLGLDADSFALATVHRAENVDDPQRLEKVLSSLIGVAEDFPVVLPLHPRTRARIADAGVCSGLEKLHIIEPASYFDMMALEASARLIVTDSGGVQKEAYIHGVPCVTLRTETEWVETVDSGWNYIAGTELASIRQAVETMLAFDRNNVRPDFFGDGHAAEKVVAAIAGWSAAQAHP